MVHVQQCGLQAGGWSHRRSHITCSQSGSIRVVNESGCEARMHAAQGRSTARSAHTCQRGLAQQMVWWCSTVSSQPYRRRIRSGMAAANKSAHARPPAMAIALPFSLSGCGSQLLMLSMQSMHIWCCYEQVRWVQVAHAGPTSKQAQHAVLQLPWGAGTTCAPSERRQQMIPMA